MAALTARSSGYDDLMSALESRSRRGGGAQHAGRCPAHEDHNPSLSWTLGDDDKILVNCHGNAGCTTQMIVEALGFGMADLFAPTSSSPARTLRLQPDLLRRRPAAAGEHRFTAYYTDGTLVPAHHVRVDDGFGGKKVWWDQSDVVEADRLALFGAHKLLEGDGSITIVEGERAQIAVNKDFPAVATYGTSVMPSDEALEVCRGKQVVLWPDHDDNGREHMKAIGSRILELGLTTNVRWVRPPRPAEPKWDAADADEETIFAAIVAAPPFVSESLAADPDVLDDDWRGLRVVASEAVANPNFDTDYIVQNLIRPRRVAVLASTEGLGKSYLRTELGVRLATGTGPFLGYFPITKPARVLVIDEEQGEDLEFDTEGRVLTALGLERADLGDRLVRYSFAGFLMTGDPDWPMFDAAIEGDHPDLVVVDTASMVIEGEEWGKDLRAVVRGLIGRTERFGCAFLLIVHLTKPQRTNPGKNQGQDQPVTVRRVLTDVMGQWGRQATSVMIMSDAAGEDRVYFDVYKRVPNVKLVLARQDGLWNVVTTADGAPVAIHLKLGLDAIDMKIVAAIADGVPAIGASGLGESAFHTRLRKLRDDGFVAPGTPYQLLSKGQEVIDSLSGAHSGESPEE